MTSILENISTAVHYLQIGMAIGLAVLMLWVLAYLILAQGWRKTLEGAVMGALVLGMAGGTMFILFWPVLIP